MFYKTTKVHRLLSRYITRADHLALHKTHADDLDDIDGGRGKVAAVHKDVRVSRQYREHRVTYTAAHFEYNFLFCGGSGSGLSVRCM